MQHIENTIRQLEAKLARQEQAVKETRETIEALRELNAAKQQELDLGKGGKKLP